MAALPPSTDFTGASVTEAQFKTAITSQRDFLAGLLGATGAADIARDVLKAFAWNRLPNPGFAVAQRGTAPTATDNAYTLDGTRILLEAANAADIQQDTADAPSNCKYAAKMTVGSGTNNKFGIFMPIEGKDMWDLRAGKGSLRVSLKATAGLTDGSGKIRIGLCQWTGSEDAISADPVTTWGAEGTNPTLSGSWAFANTPAALSVTTSWAEYTVENVSISASATNLALMIWCDEKSTTQTTDILRIGSIWIGKGTVARDFEPRAYQDDLDRCARYLPTLRSGGTASLIGGGQCSSTTAAIVNVKFNVRTRSVVNTVIASDPAHISVHQAGTTPVALTGISATGASVDGVLLSCTGASGLVAGNATTAFFNSASGYLYFTGAEL